MSFIESNCVVTIRLPVEQYVCVESPDALYICLPRIAYLGSVSDRIVAHFSEFAKRPVNSGIQSFAIFDRNTGMIVPWHLPIGLGIAESSCRLDLWVRFDIGGLNLSDFSSLLINQLKASLVIRGYGLGSFNILDRSAMDSLRSISDSVDVSNFLSVFQTVFPERGSVCAIKIYTVEDGLIHTTTLQLSATMTIDEILLKIQLASNSKMFTHGVQLLGTTPVGFLQTQCPYSDGFVHLISIRTN